MEEASQVNSYNRIEGAQTWYDDFEASSLVCKPAAHFPTVRSVQRTPHVDHGLYQWESSSCSEIDCNILEIYKNCTQRVAFQSVK